MQQNHTRFFVFLLFCFCLIAPKKNLAWGFLGHKTINRYAVFALPPELFAFYKSHIEFVTQHATDPDRRRYILETEACRHYIDCDHYERFAPLDTIPHNWYLAVNKYTEDSLTAHGIVPWHILAELKSLTEAFTNKDEARILKISADLGHYIADAHVPLHSNSNYNGQKSGQDGIHALWETRIPQLFLDSFNLFTGTAVYLANPSDDIWQKVGESFAASDTVFAMESLTSKLMGDRKYSIAVNGPNAIPSFSELFCREYESRMNDMVERRMRQSILSVASFWYTAWVNAGQPDLKSITGNLNGQTPATEDSPAPQGSMIGREEAP